MRSVRGLIPPHLRQRVDTLRVLNQMLADCLPVDCCHHCSVAGIHDGTLILVCESPAWRSRIHFYSERIIRHFKCLDNAAPTRIRMRVGRPEPPRREPRRRGAAGQPPAATARALAELAAETDDPALAASLRRLAGRGGG